MSEQVTASVDAQSFQLKVQLFNFADGQINVWTTAGATSEKIVSGEYTNRGTWQKVLTDAGGTVLSAATLKGKNLLILVRASSPSEGDNPFTVDATLAENVGGVLTDLGTDSTNEDSGNAADLELGFTVS